MTLLPEAIMGNRDAMQALAAFSEPMVRLTDKLVSDLRSIQREAMRSVLQMSAPIFQTENTGDTSFETRIGRHNRDRFFCTF